MSAMASQVTSVSIVCSTVGSGADQRNHQNSASLAFVWGIHRWRWIPPPQKAKNAEMFPFDDVIMNKGKSISESMLADKNFLTIVSD